MATPNDLIHYVYEHWRPDKDVCFYVGKGKGGRANDMRNGRNSHHKEIQEELGRLGMCVEVRLVKDGMTNKDSLSFEVERISFWKSLGVILANKSRGGEGCSGYKHTPEAIAKCVNFHTGRKRSAETCRKISKKLKGRKVDPAHIEKMAQANRGKKRPPFSAEHRAKIGAINKGRKMPSHVRDALIRANTGRSFKHTEEARAKMSASSTGKKRGPISDAHKKAISLANKGKAVTEETKEKMSICAKNRAAIKKMENHR